MNRKFMVGVAVSVVPLFGFAATASATHQDAINCHGAVVKESVQTFGNVPAAVDALAAVYPFDSVKDGQHFIREHCAQ